MKHKRGLVFICMAAGIVIVACLALLFSRNATLSTMSTNWGVTFPEKTRVVEHSEEKSFHGDGYRCTILRTDAGASAENTTLDSRNFTTDTLSEASIDIIENAQSLCSASQFNTDDTYAHQIISNVNGVLLIVQGQDKTTYYCFESIV
ncbi:hypothetical protein [Bifidobacterium oedipodis]|uniref:Lipoprotein n=1 Tax=Bifidobacterium oedipodis TaxID=2675322 RepID=A0A7Y0END8_9BIFI|nr:hypothetical protein [Bifidobacterium sp. DSM 109957]NMM93432.1 hypothetical protein [Bifidobacterium sp. DSM 109957]